MTGYHSDLHKRHSIRLQGYDYSKVGAYFVTVCTKDRECLFGDVRDGEICLNTLGVFVRKCWNDLSSRYASVELDAFVIMPNHVHGIVTIGVGAGLALPESENCTTTHNQGAASSAPTLWDIVRTFKSISAIGVNRLLMRSGQPVWQRNYYEHIIRNEDELNHIREYIMNNPIQWALDEENPDCIDDVGALLAAP